MKRLLQVAVWAVVVLVAVLFAQALARDWGNVSDTLASMSWTSWLSILLFVAAVVVSGLLWGVVVAQMSGKAVPPRDAVRVHAASWLLKYVPGQVGSLVNKIAWAQKNGYSKKLIGTSVIYENVLMVFASVLLSIPLLFVVGSEQLSDATILWSLVVIVPMLIVCNQRVFYAVLNTALRFARRTPISQAEVLPSRKIFVDTLYYMIPRVLNGVAFVLIAAAMLPVTVDMYVPFAAIFIFASIVGMLALFVPSGLGVREGVIVLLASVYIPTEQAVVLALVARFFATVADAGVLAVYVAMGGRLKV